MNNYFYKIKQFEIDSNQLYHEWMKVATKHNLFCRSESFKNSNNHILPNYYKLLINYPDHMDENIDPVRIHNDPLIKGQLKPPFSITNIVKDFQGTYTEQVLKKVGNFILNTYPVYSLGTIKYAVLKPNSKIVTHTDISDTPRFFLSASVPKGCYMESADEKIPMDETGALFRMNVNVPHSPINESDDYRVTILFDVVK
jgi:hypothetical protein